MEIRTTFHKSLQGIQDNILELGYMVGTASRQAIEALQKRDMILAQQIIDDDRKIDRKRFNIEEKCIQLIATQQPLASDLRILVSVLNIITELERIGDYAKGNASISILIGDEPTLKPLIDIPRMVEITSNMLDRSLQAFIAHDANAARKICYEDDLIDGLYDQVFRELLTFMAEDPKTITRATRLIWVAHNLERSADRIINICERIIYMVTGKMDSKIP